MKEAITENNKGCILSLYVSPGASSVGMAYNAWRKAVNIRITSPPEKGKANSDIEKYFHRITGKKVEIITGHKSHRKKLMIYGIAAAELLEHLRENING